MVQMVSKMIAAGASVEDLVVSAPEIPAYALALECVHRMQQGLGNLLETLPGGEELQGAEAPYFERSDMIERSVIIQQMLLISGIDFTRVPSVHFREESFAEPA